MANNLFLIGNPNVGKTTLYNYLTKSFEHTGNWHGVTVDKKSKQIQIEDSSYNVVDLPGLYSLSSFSFEEQVSIDCLLNNSGTIINICDGNVLERNMYLTLQLLEMNKSPIIFVNFSEEVKKKGNIYNYKKLSEILNLRVISNSINKPSEIFDMVKTNDLRGIKLDYLKYLPIEEILSFLSSEQIEMFKDCKNFLAIKMLEQDENVLNKINLSAEQLKIYKHIILNDDYLTKIAMLRYNFIHNILQQITISKSDSVYGKHKIDKIILNKYLSLPIFLVILFTIFYFTFSSLGVLFSQSLKNLIDLLSIPLKQFLLNINAPTWVIGLFCTGIVSGVGGLLSFIPQIVLLFLFLSILEDSGYMSRLAFSFEDVFYKFGLSGKSIFTILMSFGCTTSAVLTSRNIEDKNTKIKTAMLSPYMSCSAKLPIYAVIGGAFFGKGNIFIIVLMYVLGVIVGLLVTNLFNKSGLKSGERTFMLEFPPYRRVSFKRVVTVIAENCKSFIVKVATILLSFSVIVWILQNFSFTFEYLPNSRSAVSMLESIGNYLCFIFRPIGLDNYGVVVSLIVGIMAKEMVVGTMAIINKIPNSNNFNNQLGASLVTSGFVINFSPLTALIMMVFSLLYMPCVSTIAVLNKEIGPKWTAIACLSQFSIAYFICFIIYNFATGSILSQIMIGIFVVLSIIILFAISKRNYKKFNCNKLSCKKCGNCF